ncbi:tetratricopeptide repeat protein [Phaeovulum sp.]|uniref:tetratricopeptide repeat protein n=1 Tax=Phaeovulum sp. TaxID=2934796 RepID=UPI0039E37691
MPLLPPFFRPAILAAGLLLTSVPAPIRAEDAGAYLAARLASMQNDFAAASDYYSRALITDATNRLLQESALIADIALGDYDRALPLATSTGASAGGSEIAALVLLADQAHQGDYAGAIARLDAGTGVNDLVSGLFRAWSLVGTGQMSDATKIFDKVAKSKGAQAFGLYHKALALALVGDYEGADAIFSGKTGQPIRATRRGVLAHVQVLSQLERNKDAIELIDSVFGPDLDPALADIHAQLAAGEVLPFTMVQSATDGLAEMFFTVAGVLNSEGSEAVTLVYTRLAEYLRPDHIDAILMSASLLEQQQQYDLATATYALIPKDNPAYFAADLGRASALVRADRVDDAITALEELSGEKPDLPDVWTLLGDTLRSQERYEEAAKAYDKALALSGEDSKTLWFLYYARGISFERSKHWDQAEADFRKALELSPDQPQVLNYLGYSYVEKNENLVEALDMIERAAATRPDGYIIDSLGWAYYRLGRYDEAVAQMERAIEFMPVDSLVNDHLGDVYWAVGRKREAEFQWKRALSFKPETEAEASRIRRKLDVGLDVVLADEGAPPLKAAGNASN